MSIIKVANEQYEVLMKYAPDLIKYIESGDVENFFIELDDKIVEELMSTVDNSLTEKGRILQKLYDEIFYQRSED